MFYITDKHCPQWLVQTFSSADSPKLAFLFMKIDLNAVLLGVHMPRRICANASRSRIFWYQPSFRKASPLLLRSLLAACGVKAA